MKKYLISGANGNERAKNISLWNKISGNGKLIDGRWNGDYHITTYKYNNKIYELWNNFEYGIMSEIVEIESREMKMKKEIKITTNNVSELWELYEYYLDEFRKNNYSNIEPSKFEDFVATEVTICSNCERYVLVDNIGISELAMQDNICEDCMEGGYGA